MRRCLLFLIIAFSPVVTAQETGAPAVCPVIVTLASSRLASQNNANEENIVIWFFNRGKKTAHGIEFRLDLLDTAGNKYPASQLYEVKADTKPQNGDFVFYSTDDEKKFFGDKWDSIDGVVVHVSKILFRDATIWTPPKGVDCKTVFLNENYQTVMKKWDAAVAKKLNQSTQTTPDSQPRK